MSVPSVPATGTPSESRASVEEQLVAVLDRLLRPLVERLEKVSEQPRQEWFSIEQAGKLTGLSSDHIRRAVTGGVLPASNMGTPDRPLYRLSRENIQAWMKEREAGPKPPPRRKKTSEERGPLPFSRHIHPRRYSAATGS
jgi:excisionase family DNA binding protein